MAMSHQWQPLPRLKALAEVARSAKKKSLKSILLIDFVVHVFLESEAGERGTIGEGDILYLEMTF